MSLPLPTSLVLDPNGNELTGTDQTNREAVIEISKFGEEYLKAHPAPSYYQDITAFIQNNLQPFILNLIQFLDNNKGQQFASELDAFWMGRFEEKATIEILLVDTQNQ